MALGQLSHPIGSDSWCKVAAVAQLLQLMLGGGSFLIKSILQLGYEWLLPGAQPQAQFSSLSKDSVSYPIIFLNNY